MPVSNSLLGICSRGMVI